MPVRLLSSSIFKWPDKDQVEKAFREWAREQKARHPGILRIGYFGSYARSSWGVGSDLDIVVVVSSSDKPFLRRSLDFDSTKLPVPADILVYTEEEFKKLQGHFARVLQEEVIWVI